MNQLTSRSTTRSHCTR